MGWVPNKFVSAMGNTSKYLDEDAVVYTPVCILISKYVSWVPKTKNNVIIILQGCRI